MPFIWQSIFKFLSKGIVSKKASCQKKAPRQKMQFWNKISNFCQKRHFWNKICDFCQKRHRVKKGIKKDISEQKFKSHAQSFIEKVVRSNFVPLLDIQCAFLTPFFYIYITFFLHYMLFFDLFLTYFMSFFVHFVVHFFCQILKK